MNEYFDVNESGRHIWNPGAVAQVNTQTVKAEHIWTKCNGQNAVRTTFWSEMIDWLHALTISISTAHVRMTENEEVMWLSLESQVVQLLCLWRQEYSKPKDHEYKTQVSKLL